MSLPPFFSYFGSKHRLARSYPPPLHDTIIEPFAGSAGYASRHYRRKVILVEKSPRLAALWRYLISASAREILRLPDLAEGADVEGLDLPMGARALIGLNIGTARGCPAVRDSSSWGSNWNAAKRARIAVGIERIRHWKVIEGDYTAAPDVVATWYVDPPYKAYEIASERGTRMVRVNQYDTECNAKQVDFPALGRWCRSRQGQVMVCESEGGDWLPFRPFLRQRGAHAESLEVIWTNDERSPASRSPA